MSAACARLLPFLPNVFEGYRAKGPAEGGEIDLGHDSAVRVARRGYSKRSTALELEIVDTQRAAPLRELFARTRRVEQAGDDAVFKALRVQGHDAFAQWNSTSKATRVSLLVGTRYLVNLSLRPTAELDTSLVLAEQLNLHALARLALDSPIASH